MISKLLSTVSVDKIASLAYLELSDAEKSAFQTQFDQILTYMNELQKVSMSSAEATQMGAFHISMAFYEALHIDPGSTLRTDDQFEKVQSLNLTNEEALRSSPKSGGIPGELLYEVPSIIDR